MDTIDKNRAISEVNVCTDYYDAIIAWHNKLLIPMLKDISYATANGMLDMHKTQKGYGTYLITPFVNKFYFEKYTIFLEQYNIYANNNWN